MPQIFMVVNRKSYSHMDYENGGYHNTEAVHIGFVVAESRAAAQVAAEAACVDLKGVVEVVPAGEMAYIGEFRS